MDRKNQECVIYKLDAVPKFHVCLLDMALACFVHLLTETSKFITNANWLDSGP